MVPVPATVPVPNIEVARLLALGGHAVSPPGLAMANHNALPSPHSVQSGTILHNIDIIRKCPNLVTALHYNIEIWASITGDCSRLLGHILCDAVLMIVSLPVSKNTSQYSAHTHTHKLQQAFRHHGRQTIRSQFDILGLLQKASSWVKYLDEPKTPATSLITK